MPDFDLKPFLKNLTQGPGVYRMYDADGELLYVGKARNLKRRVSSYFQKTQGSGKVRRLVSLIADVQITLTHTETEALILEYNLIKEHKPRYNVLLRDDKSYPYIRVDVDHEFPRITVYRGRREGRAKYFGPYPSAHAAREAVNHLQKLFQLRNCEDSFFSNRTRPCLQHQIDRCTAPCVGLIEQERYRADVEHAMRFLEGRDTEIIDDLVARMDRASAELDYERAARYRDQIQRLRLAQEHQNVAGQGGDLDVIAAVTEGSDHCVAAMFIRRGNNLGTRTYHPKAAEDTQPQEVLSAFVAQHYLGRPAPREILVNFPVDDRELLESTLSEAVGFKVRIRRPERGQATRWMELAERNARQNLAMRMASDTGIRHRLDSLAETLGLEAAPGRIECFDISHTGGESAMGACVVFTEEGLTRSEYRRFNVNGVAAGDDYAAMRQVLTRRYTRVAKGEVPTPDLIVIDGGTAQMAQASEVLEELGLDGIVVLGIAKGRTRKPGMERVFLSGQEGPTILPADSAALHLVQQIRDEAHRFAITGHRRRRDKRRTRSALEEIEGLGPKRRRELLRQFGGLQAIARAGVEDLSSVKGISAALAQRIYDHFHSGDAG